MMKKVFFSGDLVLVLCRLEKEEGDEEDEERELCARGSKKVRSNTLYKGFELNQRCETRGAINGNLLDLRE